METPEERIQRVLREEVAIVPYESVWPEFFRQESDHLWFIKRGRRTGARTHHIPMVERRFTSH